MTTETMAPTASAPRQAPLYARLWRGVPRELGFLLPLLPIVIIGISVTSSVFFTGVGMIFIIIGVFVVLAGLYIARGLGMFELLRLQVAGFPRITPPKWDRAAPRAGWSDRPRCEAQRWPPRRREGSPDPSGDRPGAAPRTGTGSVRC